MTFQDRFTVALQRRLTLEIRAEEYAYRWKGWPMTPAWTIPALRASLRRTGGRGCSGWPTPAANDDNKNPEAHLAMKKRMGERDGTLANRDEITSLQVMAKFVAGWPTPRSSPSENRNTKSAPSHGGTHGLTLAGVAHDLLGWPTPGATDGKGPGPLERRRQCDDDLPAAALRSARPLNEQAVEMAGWKTPLVPSGGRRNPPGTTLQGRRPDGKKVTVDLREEVETVLAGWATPMSEPKGSDKMMRGNLTLKGMVKVSGTPGSSPDPTPKASTGALAPEFCCWLMGFPMQWLWVAPNGTPKKQKRKGKP